MSSLSRASCWGDGSASSLSILSKSDVFPAFRRGSFSVSESPELFTACSTALARLTGMAQ